MEFDCCIFHLKYLAFQLKTLDFDQNTRYFESEILKYIFSFSHLEFEIFDILSEIPSISKKVQDPGVLVDYMYVL